MIARDAGPPDPARQQFDLQLLQGLAGDVTAQDAEWLQAFRHFNPRLNSFFERRCDPDYSQDELVTDIWSRACLHVQSLRSSSALWSWLTTIGNNLLADHRRHRARDRESSFTDLGDGDDNVAQLLAGWLQPETRETDDSLLDDLSSEEREFLELYAIDGLSHEEIASRLGLSSPAASRQRLRRLRLRLTGDGNCDRG